MILLVEDDPKLAQMVQRYLEGEGYACSIEPRGDTAVARILEEKPRAVLLDLRLPGMDGMEVCRAVRGAYEGPILMVTARGDDIDEVMGLELGADDYLPKPVRPRVLLARLRAALRRHEASPRGALELGGLRLDPGRREVWLEGRELGLSTAEFELLHLLARNVGRPVDRETLYRELGPAPYDGLDRSMDLRVSRLRQKMGDDPGSPRWIQSIRGVGYLLKAPR